jgi:nucleotide-binding universal stress UspA family protein
MFKKILLPVDLTDKHGPALQIAGEAAKDGGRVILLHVIEIIAGLSQEEERDFFARLEAKARKHLERLGAALAQRQVAWQGEIVYGHRAAEVARVAGQMGADLIVLTAPRFDPDAPAASWGSLSWKISLLSPCPVLLVK